MATAARQPRTAHDWKPRSIAPHRSRLAEWLRLPYMDPVMLAASLGLIAFSVFTLSSATGHEIPGDPDYFVLRQSIYGLLGIAAMLALCRIDYTRLRDLRVTIYTVMIVSILLVFLVGTAVRGSDRWIELPDFRFQPSELAKVLLCVSLAAMAYERVRRPFGLRQTLTLLALGLAPAALVFLQPDLGTGSILVVLTFGILFIGGVPGKHFVAIGAIAAVLAGGAAAAGPALGVDVLQGYQQQRLTAFLHPSDEGTSDASYQVNQSTIAVGAGEELGRGDEATQTEFLFVPDRNTDFIFAVIAERFGFAGAGFVVALYALLFWRAIRVMRAARSFYGTLIVGGVLAMLAFQVLVNVGMTMGIMPVTGITLPLISYGGSSVIGTFLALGLLQSVHIQSRLAAGGARTRLGLRSDTRSFSLVESVR